MRGRSQFPLRWRLRGRHHLFVYDVFCLSFGSFGDRVGQPAVVGLASDLQHPARHRDGNPAARRRTSTSCSNALIRCLATAIRGLLTRGPGIVPGLFIHPYRDVKWTPKSFAIWATSTPGSGSSLGGQHHLGLIWVRLGHNKHPSSPAPWTRHNRCHLSVQQPPGEDVLRIRGRPSRHYRRGRDYQTLRTFLILREGRLDRVWSPKSCPH